MSVQPCPCCAWTVSFPDDPGEAVVACRECGQCLRLPEPWAKVAILVCDTRPLVGPPPGGRQPERPDAPPLVPAQLTCRVPPSTPRDNVRTLPLGLAGFALGFAVLVYSLWPGGLGRPVSPLWQVVCLGGASLILVSGISLVYQSLRKKHRCSRARILIPGELFPPEAYHLGPPYALHQRGSFTRWVLVVLGVVLLVMAAACGALVLRGEAHDGRVLELAVLGLPGGVFTVWKGCTSRGLRILVCPEGFVVCRGFRADVWRWDQIDAVVLRPDQSIRPLLGYAYALRREDGERFTLTADTEYVENQLGIRAQYELSRRMLPRLRAALAAGGMADFGLLKLSAAGVHKDQQMVPWSAITGVTCDEGRLTIRKHAETWSTEIDRLANPAVFWALAEHCRRSTSAVRERLTS